MMRCLWAILLLGALLSPAVTGTNEEHHAPGTSCVYDVEDTLELCNLKTATQRVRYEIIRGPADCAKVIVKEIDCLGCKYVPNKVYGPCHDGYKSKQEELVPGSKIGCPETRTITKACTNDDAINLS